MQNGIQLMSGHIGLPAADRQTAGVQGCGGFPQSGKYRCPVDLLPQSGNPSGTDGIGFPTFSFQPCPGKVNGCQQQIRRAGGAEHGRGLQQGFPGDASGGQQQSALSQCRQGLMGAHRRQISTFLYGRFSSGCLQMGTMGGIHQQRNPMTVADICQCGNILHHTVIIRAGNQHSRSLRGLCQGVFHSLRSQQSRQTGIIQWFRHHEYRCQIQQRHGMGGGFMAVAVDDQCAPCRYGSGDGCHQRLGRASGQKQAVLCAVILRRCLFCGQDGLIPFI